MAVATLTSKGQVTIPKKIRDHLELKAGDKVEFFISEKGKVEVIAKNLPASKLFGIIKSKKSLSIEEMDEAIADHICEKFKK